MFSLIKLIIERMLVLQVCTGDSPTKLILNLGGIFSKPSELVQGRWGHDDFPSSFDVAPLPSRHHGHRVAPELGVEGAGDQFPESIRLTIPTIITVPNLKGDPKYSERGPKADLIFSKMGT